MILILQRLYQKEKLPTKLIRSFYFLIFRNIVNYSSTGTDVIRLRDREPTPQKALPYLDIPARV